MHNLDGSDIPGLLINHFQPLNKSFKTGAQIMISSTAWIKKGSPSTLPRTYEMSEEQYKDIIEKTKTQLNAAKEGLSKVTQEKQEEVEESLAKFNLDTYDDDNIIGGGDSDDEYVAEKKHILSQLSNLDDLSMGKEDDPYLKDQDKEEQDDDEEEDKEDLKILETDNLLLATKTEDEISYLEVYVYEEADSNLYVHHDIMLPSFPLCVEWVGASTTGGDEGKNFAAIGTFEPQIEIWNLDVLDVPYPSMILGTNSESGKCHTDAVMSLSWNRNTTNLLLSGSADCTVRLWDIGKEEGLRSFEHHSSATGKVQCVQWNPTKPSVLATAAYDGMVSVMDVRMSGDVKMWQNSATADPECLKWNPFKEDQFAVSDESGTIRCWDVRDISKPVWSLEAHGKAASSFDFCPGMENLFISGSSDRCLKFWKLDPNSGIKCLVEKKCSSVGKIFSSSFSSDSPHLVSVAGSRGVLEVYNVLNDKTLLSSFQAAL